jgi:hypothetical protein
MESNSTSRPNQSAYHGSKRSNNPSSSEPNSRSPHSICSSARPEHQLRNRGVRLASVPATLHMLHTQGLRRSHNAEAADHACCGLCIRKTREAHPHLLAGGSLGLSQRSTCFTICSAMRTIRAAAVTAAFASVAEIGSGSYSARFFSGRSRRRCGAAFRPSSPPTFSR